MFSENVLALSDQAATRMAMQKRSLPAHLVRSMLAGMYVGAAIALIFTVGSYLPPESRRLLMGVCFGGALTIVIFAGSDLFTGFNLILTLGVLTRKATWRDLLSNWLWTWIGNLAGSVLLAVIVIRSGVMNADPVKSFVLGLVDTKMNIPEEQLFWRAVLANWLVCLGVWMAARIKDETARIIMIWWCMFTFITCGYEHSIANMFGLMLGVLLPHESVPGISLGGYAYNLGWATLGNIVGGAFFVAGMYWLGSPKVREQVRAEKLQHLNGFNGAVEVEQGNALVNAR
ncbi:MAG TPA: formate/nitrite transporter family protein [Gemmataceae bacterium]|jgi:nitrite transporter NirC|nr:formate/nitrite transporter family protein [Gemmataceae bacterium]